MFGFIGVRVYDPDTLQPTGEWAFIRYSGTKGRIGEDKQFVTLSPPLVKVLHRWKEL